MMRRNPFWSNAADEQIVRLTDVADDDLSRIVRDFESEGAKVDVERQRDGQWTVTAVMTGTGTTVPS